MALAPKFEKFHRPPLVWSTFRDLTCLRLLSVRTPSKSHATPLHGRPSSGTTGFGCRHFV